MSNLLNKFNEDFNNFYNNTYNNYKNKIIEVNEILNNFKNNKNNNPGNDLRYNSIHIFNDNKKYLLNYNNILMPLHDDTNDNLINQLIPTSLYGNGKYCHPIIINDVSKNSLIYIDQPSDSCNSIGKVYYTDKEFIPKQAETNGETFNNRYTNMKIIDTTDTTNNKNYYIDTKGHFYRINNDNSFNEYDTKCGGIIDICDTTFNLSEIAHENSFEVFLDTDNSRCHLENIFETKYNEYREIENNFNQEFNTIITQYNNLSDQDKRNMDSIKENKIKLKEIINEYDKIYNKSSINKEIKILSEARNKELSNHYKHTNIKTATTSVVAIGIILILFNILKK